MGLDLNKMRKNHEENQRGGDIWNPPQGLTKVYIHPPCRPDDKYEPTAGTNLITLGVHYGLGKDNGMCVCLDTERNPVLKHPFIKKLLAKKGIVLSGKCPVEKAIASGKLDGEAAAEARLNTRYLFGVTPVMHKATRTTKEWTKLAPKHSVMLCGNTIYNGIMDEIDENGDITDVTQAIFQVISREGAKKNDTKYSVKSDPDTLRKALNLPAPFVASLNKAQAVEGDCDLFKIVANMTKSEEDVKALLSGAKVKVGRGSSDDDDDELDADDDDELDEDDDELEEDEDEDIPPPPKKKKAAPPPAEEEDEDEDEEEEEDDEPPPPPPKKKKAAPPPPPVEDDEEEEEEDDDEPPPPVKKKLGRPPKVKSEEVAPPKKKKAPPPPVDEDEDEEDDEDEEEEAPPPPKKKKAAPPPVDDDDDELGLDELDAELEAISAGTVAKKKTKK